MFICEKKSQERKEKTFLEASLCPIQLWYPFSSGNINYQKMSYAQPTFWQKFLILLQNIYAHSRLSRNVVYEPHSNRYEILFLRCLVSSIHAMKRKKVSFLLVNSLRDWKLSLVAFHKHHKLRCIVYTKYTAVVCVSLMQRPLKQFCCLKL